MKIRKLTKNKILDTAFILVYINGYNGTSIDMILQKSGIPKGSLYHHFKSKKEMVLAVLKERIYPKMNDFFSFKKIDGKYGIGTIIQTLLKISQKIELVTYGCPLNRLNQEMSPVDKDFEKEITIIYESIKNNIQYILNNCNLKEDTDTNSLAEFIITTVWGSLSLNPTQSSEKKYMQSINHLISYLKSLET